MSGPHSIGGGNEAPQTPHTPHTPHTPNTIDSRPNTPSSSNHGTTTSSSSTSSSFMMEQRCQTPASATEDKFSIHKKDASKIPSLDRSNDAVYTATTSVVKAIMILSQGVEKAVANDYLDLVKNVGFELRTLLASVDQLSSVFPAQAHK